MKPNKLGYLKEEDVTPPPKAKAREGPVPLIECPEKIPCDPCNDNCPTGAIEMEGINGVPKVDYEKCSGCGLCLEVCPGLAIFMVDTSPEEGARLTIPYEFPLPDVGETVDGLNRKGEVLVQARVKAIKPREDSAGDTPTVTVKLPTGYENKVRNIRRRK